MGVRFGENTYDVERRFPDGAPETSPYGAPAYKIENVSLGAVDYQDVIFEFSEKSGMQLVVAHFTPSSSAEVYQKLRKNFGPPSSTGGINASDVSTVEASWKRDNGASATFSGPFHRLTLVGPDGAALKTDVRLRDTDVPQAP
jgi:hypothetical protein